MNRSSRLGPACVLLTLAVLAGVAELAIAVASFAVTGPSPDATPQIQVRVAVYLVAFVLIGLAWRGSRIARWLVLILLGVLGTGSLLVPLIGELGTGAGLTEALGAATSPYFPLVRAAHILLVITGSLLLLTAGRTAAGPRAGGLPVRAGHRIVVPPAE
ncbi:hypothetical protein [Microlunatus speluncae]|uniref:hypothetical protein n=1 Tax=Microlunatus speluncae TaxID=2594267 RepID=UPI001266658C|nr:hypothetical protein [Microlunatus speluncae]